MKVLIFCAKGFETMEFSVFIGVFGWARNDYAYPVEVETCGFHNQQLAELGATILNERIVVDDNIITSYCPETAPDVAFELLNKLVGTEKMRIVKKAMGY